MRLVVVAEYDLAPKLEGLPYPIRKAEGGRELEEKVAEEIGREEPVLLVSKGAWSTYWELRRKLERAGHNPFLIRPVDPREEAIAGGSLSLRDIVAAKAAYHLSGEPWRAPKTVFQGKKVTRRDLLLHPLRSRLLVLPAPLFTGIENCLAAPGCTECVDICPRGALQGKPPRLDSMSCTSCGLCTWVCPKSILSMPGHNSRGLEYLIDTVRRRTRNDRDPYHLLVACRRSLPALIKALAEAPVKPTLIVDVECPGWFSERDLLYATGKGFEVTIYCSREAYNECGGHSVIEGLSGRLQGLPVNIVDDVSGLLSILGRPPLAHATDSLPEWGPELVRSVAEAYSIRGLKLLQPLIGMVRVDPARCDLCEACVNACPTRALQTRVKGDKILLVFRHDRCTACGLCEHVCPHNALRMEKAYRAEAYGVEVALAEDEVARCRRCGAPIGSMKLIRSVEEKLRRQGAKRIVLELLWYCPRCKLHAMKELGERPD